MVSINYAFREISCKIVYYGPGLSGKTTNLQWVHQKIPRERRGELISLATEKDRTLYFDFLPLDLGSIQGFATKFQLYTVPGQVYYNATRRLVLRGADGIVFVADSQRSKMKENMESLQNLGENLRDYGYRLDDIPLVFQYNKRDLPDRASVEELNKLLNYRGVPSFEAVANKGVGVFETLKSISKIVLEKTTTRDAMPPPEPTVPPQPKPVQSRSMEPTPSPAIPKIPREDYHPHRISPLQFTPPRVAQPPKPQEEPKKKGFFLWRIFKFRKF